jgi:hypothetical protein
LSLRVFIYLLLLFSNYKNSIEVKRRGVCLGFKTNNCCQLII